MFAGEEDLGGVGLFRRGTPLGGLPRPDLPRRKAPQFGILYCKYGMPGGLRRGFSFGVG